MWSVGCANYGVTKSALAWCVGVEEWKSPDCRSHGHGPFLRLGACRRTRTPASLDAAAVSLRFWGGEGLAYRLPLTRNFRIQHSALSSQHSTCTPSTAQCAVILRQCNTKYRFPSTAACSTSIEIAGGRLLEAAALLGLQDSYNLSARPQQEHLPHLGFHPAGT